MTDREKTDIESGYACKHGFLLNNETNCHDCTRPTAQEPVAEVVEQKALIGVLAGAFEHLQSIIETIEDDDSGNARYVYDLTHKAMHSIKQAESALSALTQQEPVSAQEAWSKHAKNRFYADVSIRDGHEREFIAGFNAALTRPPVAPVSEREALDICTDPNNCTRCYGGSGASHAGIPLSVQPTKKEG